MKGSVATVPEPTTASSAILFHCATVFPGGSAADASRVVPADAATANATAATAASRRTCVLLRFMDLHPLWWRGSRSTLICFTSALLSRHEMYLRALLLSVIGLGPSPERRRSHDCTSLQ